MLKSDFSVSFVLNYNFRNIPMSNIYKLMHYHDILYFTSFFVVVIQHFDQIEQYISRCDHLPANDEWAQAENCSGTHHYKCALGELVKRNCTNQIKISVVVIRCIRIPNKFVHVLFISYSYVVNAMYVFLFWFMYTYQIYNLSILQYYFPSKHN